MLDRINENSQVIAATLADNLLKFDDEIEIDLKFIKEFIELLSPFEEFTKLLSLRDASISLVLPTYYLLKKKLASYDNENALLMTFAKAVQKGLASRMAEFEEKR